MTSHRLIRLPLSYLGVLPEVVESLDKSRLALIKDDLRLVVLKPVVGILAWIAVCQGRLAVEVCLRTLALGAVDAGILSRSVARSKGRTHTALFFILVQQSVHFAKDLLFAAHGGLVLTRDIGSGTLGLLGTGVCIVSLCVAAEAHHALVYQSVLWVLCCDSLDLCLRYLVLLTVG